MVRRARALALALLLVAGGPAALSWAAQETGLVAAVDDASRPASVLAAKPDAAGAPVSPWKDRRLFTTLGGLVVLAAVAGIALTAWRGRTPLDDERGRPLLLTLPALARAPPAA